jgi:hypothetical protein
VSNLTDFLQAISEDSKGATDLAGGLLGLTADLSGAIGLIDWFRNQGQPSNADLQAALDKLQAAVNAETQATDTGVAALGLQANFQAVDTVMDQAKGAFGTLATIDPQDETSVSNVITTCYTAMTALRDDVGSKWTVPFAGGATCYEDAWSGSKFPPHTNVMFSYTYVLLQFIRAIGFFIAVIQGLKPSALPDYLADLGQCADRLQNVYDTIMATLVGTRVPQASDVAFVWDDTPLEELRTAWSNDGVGRLRGDPNLWPFGAVEEYSGANDVGSYWQFLPFMIDPGPPGDLVITDGFLRLLQLRIEDRKKALYKQAGLTVVLRTINRLRTITGQPLSASEPFERWSVRNALSILGVSLHGAGLFQSLRAFLTRIPPYSGGILFPVQAYLTYPASALPQSFRSLFAPISPPP